MRAAPKPPVEVKRKPVWTCDARVVLITRLFGGGARTREVDDLCWLRSSAAKSALRSWWRAAHAHEFESLETLRQKEQQLFGAPGTFDKDGKVQGGPGALTVTTSGQLATAPATYRESLGSPLNYALFPAQDMGQEAARVAEPSPQSWSVIHLASPAPEEERKILLESLRIWLTLGGVGARSRRGCGAVAVGKPEEARKLGLPATLPELEAFLRRYCARRDVNLDGLFSLARTRKVFLGRPESTGEKAQIELLKALKKARQDRKQSKNKYGRSNWPEPQAVRLKHDPHQDWLYGAETVNAGQYPRVALGLPIILHFKDKAAEPPDHHILGALPDKDKWKKLERYSSPLLLRPVRIWERDRAVYIPVAIFTDCTLPAEARPLVTTDPKGDAKARDVMKDYDIRAHADATLARIEKVFENDGTFRSLF
ncbi:MAG TPA: RAMP superfamily CRISPR-associated protein [Thermoanaerobaculia bacterium]